MFTLSEKQKEQINEWVKIQESAFIEKQKQNIDESDPFYEICKSCWEDGYPYTGAIGGDLKYSFIPTSLGTLVEVEYLGTGEVLYLPSEF